MATGAESLYTPEDIAIAMVRAAGAAFTNAGARGAWAGTAAAPVGTNGVTRTGAGVYTATLSNTNPAPSATTNLVGTVYGATDSTIVVEHTSDTVKTVRTFDQAGAAADRDFDLVVRRVGPF